MRLNIPALSICLIVTTMTGCAGLGSPKSAVRAELSQTGITTTSADGAGKMVVIFQPDQGQPERLELPLTEPTTVQQTLVQTGALKKFGRIEVEIHRQRPGGGGYFVIPCEYDRSTRQIDPVNDYALMPGDRVVVKEDPSGVIDDILQSASGNLGKRFTTGGKHKASSKYRIEG